MNHKKPWGSFKPIGNSDPQKENKYIFIAMIIIVAAAFYFIFKAAFSST